MKENNRGLENDTASVTECVKPFITPRLGQCLKIYNSVPHTSKSRRRQNLYSNRKRDKEKKSLIGLTFKSDLLSRFCGRVGKANFTFADQ